MTQVLASYLLWAPAIVGLGSVLLFVSPKRHAGVGSSGVFLLMVAGFAVLCAAGTTLNFFTPLSPNVDLALLAIGWVCLLVRIRFVTQIVRSSWQGPILAWILVVIAVSVWAAFVAVKLPLPYDTGLYHLQAIKWMTQNQLPFGLANLHGRFGFNSIWFSGAAALEIPLIEGKSSFVVNSLLFAAYGVAAISGVMSVVRRRVTMSELFLALSAVMWLWHARWEFLGSPSPEVPVLLLGVFTMYTSIRALEDRENASYHIFIAIMSALFTVAVKLSGLPILLAPLGALTWIIARRAASSDGEDVRMRELLAASGAVSLLLLVPWVARGIVMSGYLAYPISWTRLGFFPWTSTLSQAVSEQSWILSWARHPGATPEQTLGNWDWFPEWLDRFRFNSATAIVTRTASAGLLFLTLAGKEGLRKSNLHVYLIPGVAPAVGIAFWFLTAPDLRFGLASFWSIGLIVLSAGIWRLQNALGLFASVSSRAALFAALGILLAAYSVTADVQNEFEIGKTSTKELTSWPKIQSAAVHTKPTTEGISVYVLESSKEDQCWDAPLPCTPYWADLVIEKDKAGNFRSFRPR